MSEQKGKWLWVKSPADLRPGDCVRYWDDKWNSFGDNFLRKVNEGGDKIVAADNRTVWYTIEELFEQCSHVEVWKRPVSSSSRTSKAKTRLSRRTASGPNGRRKPCEPS